MQNATDATWPDYLAAKSAVSEIDASRPATDEEVNAALDRLRAARYAVYGAPIWSLTDAARKLVVAAADADDAPEVPPGWIDRVLEEVERADAAVLSA